MDNSLNVGRVMVPVADQDAAIKWYEEKLGFSTLVDVPYAGTERWVEIAPPGGGAAIALVSGERAQPGREMGIALDVQDPRAMHGEMRAAGVDCDDIIGGEDTDVPAMFFFRDGDRNSLLIVQRPEYAG